MIAGSGSTPRPGSSGTAGMAIWDRIGFLASGG